MVTDVQSIVDRYLAIWNETEPNKRRDLIAQPWTEDAVYLDPMMRGEGHDGIDAMIAGVHAQFPDCRFRKIGKVDSHNDRVRFSWELGLDAGTALAGGTDFGDITEGRLQSVTGFLDFAPVAAGSQTARTDG